VPHAPPISSSCDQPNDKYEAPRCGILCSRLLRPLFYAQRKYFQETEKLRIFVLTERILMQSYQQQRACNEAFSLADGLTVAPVKLVIQGIHQA
jgi:hypothetical protein